MKTLHKNVTKKDLLAATAIVCLGFILQPFAMVYTQQNIAPKVMEYFSGSTTAGIGESISAEGLKYRGNPNAEIVLVEYSDYECPFCSRFHPTAKNAVDNSNGKIAWIYKHFPLQIHQNAEPAAIAAECVAKISGTEKFWAYTDILVDNQQDLSAGKLATYAANLGVNLGQFNLCIKDPAMKAIVDKDQAEGAAFGVQGTPNTFVAKRVGDRLVFKDNINGAQPDAAVAASIQKAIDSKDGKSSSNTIYYALFAAVVAIGLVFLGKNAMK